MGNYIYSYIRPTHVAPISEIYNESLKTDSIEPNVEFNVKPVEESSVENITNQMAIHPYLLEYGTKVMSDNIMINNTVYKYTKTN